METPLTQSTLQELVAYNLDTGEFTWNHRPLKYFESARIWASWNAKHASKPCGYVNYGRLKVQIFGQTYFASRLAFLLVTGEWPADQVDHIDQNPLNNAWDNLRQVRNVENQKNLPIRRDNKSGVTGVCWHRKTQKWEAYISIEGALKYLGVFVTLEDAVSTRKAAEERYGYHLNHGKNASQTPPR